METVENRAANLCAEMSLYGEAEACSEVVSLVTRHLGISKWGVALSKLFAAHLNIREARV